MAAREARLPFETAAAILVERALLDDDLGALGLGSFASLLDAAAAEAAISIELSEGQSAYLRVLYGNERRPAENTTCLVAIPMRLTERIGDEGADRLLRAKLLPSARLWERAAVISGRTMSEWATLAALRRSR
ncbi:MAG: hypothetical protein WD249_09300 [Gaiellaceae bacterium]